MLGPVAFALFTPLGLLATYLVLTSIYRIAASYRDEAQGDPLLTSIDAMARRLFGSHQQHSERTKREQLERADEPDRRYGGDWARRGAQERELRIAATPPEASHWRNVKATRGVIIELCRPRHPLRPSVN